MSDTPEPTSDLRITWARREQQLEAFEAAWNRGQPPVLEEFLTEVGEDERLAVLVEMIEIDLERRVRAGLPVDVATYLERFPELSRAPESVLELICSEYRRRLRRDPNLDREEFLNRFPAYRTGLLERLAARTTRDSGLKTSKDDQPSTAILLGPPQLKGYEILG